MLLLGAIGPGACPAARAQVRVEAVPALHEIVYKVDDGPCSVTWTIVHSIPDNGLVRQRSACTLPIDKQIALAEQILVKFIDDKEAKSRLKIWAPGGLRDFAEIQERLVLLARRSANWDVARGKPKSGGVGAFVTNLANQESLFREWQDLFARHGLQLRLSRVDEIVVSDAGRLPYFAKLRSAGVRPKDKVPTNFLSGFSVEKREE